MKNIALLIACVAVVIPGWTDEISPARSEMGNVVVEGVPEIPRELAARMNQYENTRSADFQDWHPDGSGLLILTRFSRTDQVHFISNAGADRRQLTFLDEPVSLALYPPKVNPNGFLFSMDQGGDEFFQLYWFEIKTGNQKLLTDGGRSRNVDPVWSNSGHAFAFSSTSRNGKDLDLYLIENVDPKTRKLIKQVTGSWEVLDWSNDDQTLLLKEYISINESYLWLHNLKTGRTEEITSRSGTEKIGYGPGKFAQHANGIFYASDEVTEFRQLYFYDLATKQKTALSKNIAWDITALAVSKDGKWIAYVANEGGRGSLYLSDTSMRSSVKIAVPQGVISDIKFDLQSKRLAFGLNRSVAPQDVYVIHLVGNRNPVRWTFSEVGGLNPESFVEPELIEYSTFDGRKIPAFYYRSRSESNHRSPVVIHIHGGPESQVQTAFNPLFQYWVNELKISVLAPNVRGSNGYGKSYLMMDNTGKREDSVKDIGKLLDWIVTRPELDPKRVAVYGQSYGGYMVLASMTHYNDRLCCAVDIYGISNFVTFLESTEQYRRDLRRAEYGDERNPEMRSFLQEISPLNNAQRISKPLLVIQGKNDPRVPLSESEQFVKAIRKNGGVVWYILFKDEGHGIKKKENRDFQYNAVGLFFLKYLF